MSTLAWFLNQVVDEVLRLSTKQVLAVVERALLALGRRYCHP